nr:hypothetical protein [Lachnospiraceae bacterium]
MKNVHDNSYPYEDKLNAVMLVTDSAKLPGSYNHFVLPIGPQVDHDALSKVQFKRTPIKVTEAIDKGILQISVDPITQNNAGGALPGNVKITFAGKVNSINLQCNSQSFEVADPEGIKITLKLDVTNNKKSGTGYIDITGDGKVLKGKATKAAQFGINPKSVDSNIMCLEPSDYKVVFGKLTDTIFENNPGTVYAIVGTALKPQNDALPVPGKNITLCQSYYKNESDAAKKLASLATIPATKYKLTVTKFYPYNNKYKVLVSNGFGGDYSFKSGIELWSSYTVYDTSAKITGIQVGYDEDGDSVPDRVLRFPENKKEKLTFTGGRFDENRLQVQQVYLKVNGTEITLSSPYDFDVEYGSNLATGTGTIKVKLKHNDYYNSYDYGGNATFNFTIDKGVNVTM